jgi:hypothetical protein
VSILSCIKRPSARVFRRLYFKRLQQNGDYETDWQEIPGRYVKSWGNVQYSLEDIKPNHFKYSSNEMSLLNNDGYFSRETQAQSFFYGFLGIHKTLVKIDAGYIDTDGTEYPTSPTLFMGVIDVKNSKYSSDNIVKFKADHISKIFDDLPADQIPGMGTTQTAHTIVGRIRDYVDGNGTEIFQKYITSGAWNLTATTAYYNPATSTSLQNETCWGLMKKLAEAENYVLYVDNTMSLWFKERSNIPASITFHFSGVGDANKAWGHTIMKSINVDDGYDRIYNRIKVKWDKDETTSSYYIYNENWTWGDSSSSYRFGVSEYSYENTFISSLTTAQNIATSIFNEFSEPKTLVTFDSKFVPQVELLDLISLTYRSHVPIDTGSLWGKFNWGSGTWGKYKSYNININNDEFYVTEVRHNLDKFVSTFKARAS